MNSESVLLSPLFLGKKRIPNRVALGAHRTNLAEDGRPGQSLTGYYAARTNGGCGMIVVGEVSLFPNDRPYEKMIAVYPDSSLEAFGRMVTALKAAGALVLVQLKHRGFQSSGMISRMPLWGPVAVADVANCELSKQMEPEDMAQLVAGFARGAERLMETGIDGVEVSIGHRSLLRQFLSPVSNQRRDGYGGDLSGRLRLSLEILAAVRKVVREEGILGVELCLDEMFWGGADDG